MITSESIERVMDEIWAKSSGGEPDYMIVDGEIYDLTKDRIAKQETFFKLKTLFPTLGDSRKSDNLRT